MPNRSRKQSNDLNQNAFSIVNQVTSGTKQEPKSEKNPAAVALGRLGGLKGGRARADKLSARKRKEIAQKAAKTRWKRN